MSLEYFIDIRFGDPVLSLSMNSYGLLYGSSIGRILFYTFHVQQEHVIAEFSEECIRGCYVTNENALYIAVGDRYCIAMTSPTSHKQLVHHDLQHVDEICLSSQVMMKEDLVCIVPLSESSTEGVVLTHISTFIKKKYPMLPFKPHSVPYDFDGDRMLWMEWEGKIRNFKFFDFLAAETKNIVSFHKNFGQIGMCKLVQGLLVFVKDFRVIIAYELANGKEKGVVGKHRSDIVALNWVKVRDRNCGNKDQQAVENGNDEKVLYISIDYNCNICIWEFGTCLYRFNITDFAELTTEYKQEFYFTMGYPYFLTVHDRRIAFSTDIGVLVASIPYLSQVSIITD